MKTKKHISLRCLYAFVVTLLLASFTPAKAQTAYAVWCSSNATMYFTASSYPIKAGGTYGGNTITNVWSGNLVTQSSNTPEWNITVRSGLKRVVFEQDFKDVLPTNCKQWFYRCKNLTSITGLEYLNTANVKSMMEMFRECEMLSTIDVSKFDTKNVESMESMFNGCKSLSSLDVSMINTQKLTDMKNMFSGCESLTTLKLVTTLNTAFTASNAVQMYGLFSGCKKLTELDMTNLSTSNVKDMSYMFNGCSSLKSLDLRNFDVRNVTSMSYMFNDCSSLTSIKCNKTWSANSSANMFLGCLKLKGAIAYDPQKLDVKYANPNNGYFYTSVDYDLYINGVRVDSHNCDDLTQIEGVTLTKSTGKAVYYPNVRRLYLTDVNIKANSGIGIQSAISNLEIICNGKVTIQGPKGMQLEASTTITANKEQNVSLNVSSTSIGILIYDGTTTVTGGLTCTVTSQNYGIVGRNLNGNLYGILHISDGNTTVEAQGNKFMSIGLLKEFKLFDDLKITLPTGATINTTGYNEVIDQNNNYVKKVLISNPDKPVYDIKICGQQVNASNCSDLTKISGVSVSNGGYAKYDPSKNTLSLKNVMIEDWREYLVECYSQGLVINLEGENTIRQESEEGKNALYIHAATTITGGGTLTCRGGYNGAGILIHDATLYIENAIVETRGQYGVKGNIGHSRLSVKEGDGKLTAYGYEETIYNLNEIEMEGDVAVLQPDGASYVAYPTYSIVDSDNKKVSAQTVVIATKLVDYGLEIAGIPITSKNYKNITELVAATDDESMEAFFNGMQIKYYPERNELYLRNAFIKGKGESGFGIYNKNAYLIISLSGNNHIESEKWTGICHTGKGLTFSGPGSLNIKGVRGIDIVSASENDLIFREGAQVTCEGSLYGIEGAASTNRFTGAVRKYFTTFNFFDTKTVVRVKGAEESIRKIKDLKLATGLAITEPAGASFSDNTIMAGGQAVKGKFVVISAGSSSKKGDVNLDGKVDISDIVAIINTIAGDNTYKATADVNSDNNIDISDIVAVINIIAAK